MNVKKIADIVSVYHIVKHADKYNIDEGYIGVTSNFERRKSQHFLALSENNHRNYKLQQYYQENRYSIEMYIYKSFPADAEINAYKLEEFLRPKPNIGLNIATGGLRNSEDIFSVKEFTETTILQSKPKNWFSALKSSLMTLDKKVAMIADESLAKAEYRQKNQAREIDVWKKQQDHLLNLKISSHNKRTKLSEEDLQAIQKWKDKIE